MTYKSSRPSKRGKHSPTARRVTLAAPGRNKVKQAKIQHGRPRVAKGVRSVENYVEASLHKDATAAAQSRLGSYALETKSEFREDLIVSINPYHLSQFIFGYVTSVLSSSDSFSTPMDAYKISKYFLRNMSNPLENYDSDEITLSNWPKPLLALAASLRPRSVGNYNYIPTWDWVDDNGSRAFDSDTSMDFYLGFNYYLIRDETTNLNGYLSGNNGTPRNEYPLYMAKLMAPYNSQFDLVPVSDIDKYDCKDASAFCFSVPISQTFGLYKTSNDPLFVSCTTGSIGGYTTYYLKAVGSAGSETPVHHPWLASLRLGTQSRVDLGQAREFVNEYSRMSKFTIPCYSPPSTVGYLRNNMHIYTNQALLKQVPGVRTLQQINGKLSYLYNSDPTWQQLFSNWDVNVLGYLLLKKQLKRYSGTQIGVFFSGSQAIHSEPLYLHSGTSQLSAVKIPQQVDDLISTLSLAIIGPKSNRSIIIPWVSLLPLNETYYNITDLSVNFTGTDPKSFGPMVSASTPAGITNNRCPVNSPVVTWKRGEAFGARICNMTPPRFTGETLLDCAVTTTPGYNGISGIVSTRKINDVLSSFILNNIAAVSYLISYTNEPTTVSHVYGMKNTKYYDNKLNPTEMRLSSTDNGFVTPGTLSSNNSDNRGPDNNFVRSTLASLVPTHGEYCGPDYSAGERGAPLPKSGKYGVAPIDPLDGICKTHDEAYGRAELIKDKSERLDAIYAADQEFADSFDSLSVEDKSAYGRLAAIYFRNKPSHRAYGRRDE